MTADELIKKLDKLLWGIKEDAGRALEHAPRGGFAGISYWQEQIGSAKDKASRALLISKELEEALSAETGASAAERMTAPKGVPACDADSTVFVRMVSGEVHSFKPEALADLVKLFRGEVILSDGRDTFKTKEGTAVILSWHRMESIEYFPSLRKEESE